MCGRLNIIDDPLSELVSEFLGIEFSTATNTDLRPSEQIAAVIRPPSGFAQVNANWGIKPEWSSQLLINAQSETAAQKPTFKAAFGHSRCLVPCSGWYEWKNEDNKKVKYAFTQKNEEPLYMGGILFSPNAPQLVTLTTAPTPKCAEIHKRMPVLIQEKDVERWFSNQPDNLIEIMAASEDIPLAIKAVGNN